MTQITNPDLTTSVEIPAAQGIVRMQSVTKSYGPTTVLHDVDFTVHEGEVVSIIGPSGSGKSTLLRCINHLEEIDSGTIEIQDQLIGYE